MYVKAKNVKRLKYHPEHVVFRFRTSFTPSFFHFHILSISFLLSHLRPPSTFIEVDSFNRQSSTIRYPCLISKLCISSPSPGLPRLKFFLSRTDLTAAGHATKNIATNNWISGNRPIIQAV